MVEFKQKFICRINLIHYEKDDIINGDNIDYDCLICHQLPRKPANLKCCGKIYCYECLEKLLIGSPRCPICRKTQRITDIVLNPYILEKINGLTIKCPNQRCKELMVIGVDGRNVKAHLDKCSYTQCECSGCSKIFNKKTYIDHLTADNKCPYRFIICVPCDKYIQHHKKQIHDESPEHRIILQQKYHMLIERMKAKDVIFLDTFNEQKKRLTEIENLNKNLIAQLQKSTEIEVSKTKDIIVFWGLFLFAFICRIFFNRA
ncbi:MAG: TNF receptor-associated factor 5-like [Harvfovirus sp.]|uniref:TNF receptor-associated factor 5-like n=1 Tax=Harvfovirus sp. TaxID=2487768 RepID=A0A3G5A1X5_9VIRU|nr:MAG: TNF receptor-associated factor 5-like [Harvfovirus sp.]